MHSVAGDVARQRAQHGREKEAPSDDEGRLPRGEGQLVRRDVREVAEQVADSRSDEEEDHAEHEHKLSGDETMSAVRRVLENLDGRARQHRSGCFAALARA